MHRLLLSAAVLLVLGQITRAEPDVVLADFEGADFGSWTVTGEAFGKGPARGTLPNQMRVSGFQGEGLLNSYVGGDGTQGSIVSPPFTIQHRYLNFLIGGGNHAGKTCMNLLVDGKVVRTAAGWNSERLDWETWDVGELLGRTAVIEIVDRHIGGWGHVSVDQIVQSEQRKAEDIATTPLYHETFRPQFHFTARHNWINDPNGLVFYKGEYHLFFQHNPLANVWGNMTWGHAVSPDLLRWEQLPNALEPDSLGTMFSGSAVVDTHNTAGFQQGDEKVLVAMYTAAGGASPESKGQPFTQCIAYSTDAGRTWIKYPKNPVLGHIAHENRDPKVIWYEPEKKWLMALYLEKNDFAFFSSPDLKQWTQLQKIEIPGCDECPDFFPMPIDGDNSRIKWVFVAANGKYVVGAFDGQKFTPEQELRQVDFGRNYYAGQTFSDMPDGRRIAMSWMRDGIYPRMPFNQQLSFPVEMKLKSTSDGPRIFLTPVKEVESLHGKSHEWNDVALKPGENPLSDLKGELFDIRAEFELGDAEEVGFTIRGQPIVYSARNKKLSALGDAPLEPEEGRIKLHLLVDRTSIETYANDGRVSLTSCFVPPQENKTLEVFARGGPARIVSLKVHELKSAWPAPGEGKE